MKLKEGDSVQEHIRQMTEIFKELAVIVKEEDQVVYLLASLPESYDMLVTALEANADVPQIDVVTERLLHEERKQRDREDDRSHSKAMTTATYSRGTVKCYHCGKPGHIKWNCPHLDGDEKKPKLQESQEVNMVQTVTLMHLWSAMLSRQWVIQVQPATCAATYQHCRTTC